MLFQRILASRFALAVPLFGLLTAPGHAPAQTGEPRPFVARDVAVYLLDAYGNKLNDRELFQSTLPSSANPGRPSNSTAPNAASPIGRIAFEGPSPGSLDVVLDPRAGKGLSAWPRASLRRGRTIWENLRLTSTSPSLLPLPQDHWLTPLRHASSLHLQSENDAECCLLYDTELAYRPILKVTRTKAAADAQPEHEFTVENAGGYPVHDVIMLQPSKVGVGWHITHLETVPGVPSKKPKSERPSVRETPAGQQTTDPESVFVRPLGNKDLPETNASTDPDAETSRSLETDSVEWTDFLTADGMGEMIKREQAKQRIPALLEGRSQSNNKTFRAKFVDQPPDSEVRAEFDLSEAEYQEVDKSHRQLGLNRISLQSFNQNGQQRYQAVWLAFSDEKLAETRSVSVSETLAAPSLPSSLRRSLQDLDVDPAGIEHVERVLNEVAFNSTHATIVYRLDPEEIDALLPLEITPEPDRRVRVALVVLLNADPDFPEYVRGIIAELGNSSWKQREAAMKRLRELGLAAKTDLKEALKSKDPEIAWRAEILVEELK